MSSKMLSATAAPMDSSPLISEDSIRCFNWVNFMLCEVIAVFGTGANIINVICFVKLGLKDSINISFLGLAISDLGSVATLIWISICMFPAFRESDIPFDSVDILTLTTGWPHIVFTRVTSCITALITLERCLCITMPLKVKSILTPQRVAIIITSIFIIIICGVSPIYFCSSLAWVYSPERNRTRLRIVYTDNRAIHEQITMSFTNVVIPFGAYLMVILCTIVLVVELRKKTRWRLKYAAKADSMSERDQKLVRMVLMISALFIACFMPLCFTFIAILVEPRIAIDGQYKNTLFVFGGLSTLLEDANSAMNIFIYYHMSCKYRAVFHHTFGIKQ